MLLSFMSDYLACGHTPTALYELAQWSVLIKDKGMKLTSQKAVPSVKISGHWQGPLYPERTCQYGDFRGAPGLIGWIFAAVVVDLTLDSFVDVAAFFNLDLRFVDLLIVETDAEMESQTEEDEGIWRRRPCSVSFPFPDRCLALEAAALLESLRSCAFVVIVRLRFVDGTEEN